MMESLLKKSYGFTNKDESKKVTLRFFEEKRSANCNICRNFSNIFDLSHRLSTSHQNKLTERFKIIRAKMKMVKLDSIAVHDNEWGKKDDFWCYFCDKSVAKHQAFEGCIIESLGYLTHLSDVQHMKAVKSYLKYHGRKENYELFCMKKEFLEKFMDKVPEAKKKYLAKLNFIHQKDVAHIKKIEAERQTLVSEAFQVPYTINTNEAANHTHVKEVSTQQTRKIPKKISPPHKQNTNLKICPWLMKEKESNGDQEITEKPVIGPTIDTLIKHVAHQKKKMLPVKRLGANFHRKKNYSSHWLPSFSGVWNKGRHRQMKSNNKNTK